VPDTGLWRYARPKNERSAIFPVRGATAHFPFDISFMTPEKMTELRPKLFQKASIDVFSMKHLAEMVRKVLDNTKNSIQLYVILFLSCGSSKILTIPKELLTLQIWFLAISG